MQKAVHRGAAACQGLLHLSALQGRGIPSSLPLGRVPSHLPYRFLQVRMVEGHQCHRVGHAHRRLLMGHRFKAHSPNKRFTEGAAAISDKVLSRIEVHGKQLFYFFGDVQDPVVMQIHFGMSGAFRTMAVNNPREERETTRLVLHNEEHGLLAHLSAMTVQHGDADFYTKMAAKLGPDPLREDADGELLWMKMQTSRKPVGLILMDQTAVAGVGNIYRAEILFKAGVHPEQPCNTVDRAAFERIWHHTVTLLQRGFQSGSILTVDPEDAKRLGHPWTRRYVYNHSSCGKCGSKISCWDMATRTVYACETCQPLLEGTVLPAARSMALAAAHPTKEFKSHCAPEDSIAPANMTVIELKHKLNNLGILSSKSAKKGALVAQLEAALAASSAASSADTATAAENAASQQLTSPGPSQVSWIEAEAQTGIGGEDRGQEESLPAQGAVVVKEDTESQDLSKLTITELKARLKAHRLPLSGKKADLVVRLSGTTAELEAQAVAHVSSPQASTREGSGEVAEASAAASGEDAAKVAATFATKEAASRGAADAGDAAAQAPQPGTQQLDKVASAEAAALEKQKAGEGRNVEHVALLDDAVPEPSKAKRGAKRKTASVKAAKDSKEAKTDAEQHAQQGKVSGHEQPSKQQRRSTRKR